MREKIKNGGNIAAAQAVGGRLAEKAKDAVFEKLAFDRGGSQVSRTSAGLSTSGSRRRIEVLTDMVNMEKTNKQEKSEFIEKMIAVNRVTKVIKGGRVLRFSAVMVVGRRGRQGGHGHRQGARSVASGAKSHGKSAAEHG